MTLSNPNYARSNGHPQEWSPHPHSEVTYVGTVIGESTSREIRLALSQGSVREQEMIAIEGHLENPETQELESVRIWLKVLQIERLNPLFPAEAGHELAALHIDPVDTILSLSREMVTAVCRVIGAERSTDHARRLHPLRYPPKPASSAYRPSSAQIAQILMGSRQTQHRALDLATLSTRSQVSVRVDGDAIVSRHLAILAMTGAGKSWTARRLIEELGKKGYPIVIFDPHGEYTHLAEVPGLRTRRYYAQFPILDQDADTVAEIVDSLGYELTETMRGRFHGLFNAAKAFYRGGKGNRDIEHQQKNEWLAHRLQNDKIKHYGIQPNLWLLAQLAEAAEQILKEDNGLEKQQLEAWGWKGLRSYTGTDGRTLEGIRKRIYRAARELQRMEQINRRIAGAAEPLPNSRSQLVQDQTVSILSLSGYSSDFQATIYSLICNSIFSDRVQGSLPWPVLLVLEEAHNFVPARSNSRAEANAIAITKQIAQEGRKFNVGLVLISQRPARVDATTLAMCNSQIIMRMVNPTDQKYVREVVESLGEEEARLLPELEIGEALLAGQMVQFPVLTRIKPPISRGQKEEKDAFQVLEEARRLQR